MGMNITEFLLARITEDEYDANRELSWGTTQALTNLHARVLAECAAKRAIVAENPGMVRLVEGLSAAIPGNLNQDPDAPWRTIYLRHLAAVYADHPDYRQEWTA